MHLQINVEYLVYMQHFKTEKNYCAFLTLLQN